MTDNRSYAGLRIPDRLRPKPLEVACGLAIGSDPAAARPARGGSCSPRKAMTAAVLRGLECPPCLVSFSGGRDSSAVLATATRVAREEGLPLPVPITYRFAGVPKSHEDNWQEQVVRHLDLPNWEKLHLTDEIDSVGPMALGVLGRVGLVWPFNAHFHAPMLRRAADGSLLTGVGGDELFSSQTWGSARLVLSGRQFPRRSRVKAVGLALAPPPLRRRPLVRQHRVRWPWLHPEVDDTINVALARFHAATPISWSRGVGWWWRSRARTVLDASLNAMAVDAGAVIVQPFLDEGVVGAVATHFGVRGPINRSGAMRALFGDVLPEAVISRTSKGSFNGAFFSRHSRTFAASWNGAGVDPALVDVERLCLEWQSEDPDPRSFLLMQAAALASVPRG